MSQRSNQIIIECDQPQSKRLSIKSQDKKNFAHSILRESLNVIVLGLTWRRSRLLRQETPHANFYSNNNRLMVLAWQSKE